MEVKIIRHDSVETFLFGHMGRTNYAVLLMTVLVILHSFASGQFNNKGDIGFLYPLYYFYFFSGAGATAGAGAVAAAGAAAAFLWHFAQSEPAFQANAFVPS
jgi:hypothetical protein